jgi:hypothetical protein
VTRGMRFWALRLFLLHPQTLGTLNTRIAPRIVPARAGEAAAAAIDVDRILRTLSGNRGQFLEIAGDLQKTYADAGGRSTDIWRRGIWSSPTTSKGSRGPSGRLCMDEGEVHQWHDKAGESPEPLTAGLCGRESVTPAARHSARSAEGGRSILVSNRSGHPGLLSQTRPRGETIMISKHTITLAALFASSLAQASSNVLGSVATDVRVNRAYPESVGSAEPAECQHRLGQRFQCPRLGEERRAGQPLRPEPVRSARIPAHRGLALLMIGPAPLLSTRPSASRRLSSA